MRAILWTEHHHLLPHAWLVGLLYTHQSAVMRQSFLLGHFSNHGWWYYFPLAMAFKTPLATLLALLAAFLVLIRCRPAPWMAICLAAPVIIYGGMAMRSNLNLGLRHILPIYPYLFIAIGGAASAALRLWPTRSRAAIGALALGLAVESLAAFPNYIAFFNVAAGGPRGGFHLLGDSNLDWGQDLKLLAQWQQMHPNVELYLNSFGTADPGTYGIRYLNLPGGYLFGPPPVVPRQPGVIAITATQLQTIYMPPELRHAYMSLWNIPPLAVLGGTVYLYRFPQPGLTAANFPDSLLKHAAPQLGAP